MLEHNAQLEPSAQPAGCALSPWYALCTRHQHEKTVAQSLAGKGFEAFLPLYRTLHQWKDRTKQLSLPLFPGYIFLRAGRDRHIQVLTTPGVFHFVSSADRAVSIEQAEIDFVRRLTDRGSKVEPHPFLRAGDRVRVKTGPLADLEGILTYWKGAFRLVLSVELLRQAASVEVDAARVERVAYPPNHRASRYVC
jgi:transcription antitermination factor NusG